MPRMKGSYAVPRKANAWAPRLMRNESRMKRSHRCAIRYAAMEFAPITTKGKAHLRHPLTSVSQQKPARKRKQRPPLNSVHAGVQMRFTTGQMPRSEEHTSELQSLRHLVCRLL